MSRWLRTEKTVVRTASAWILTPARRRYINLEVPDFVTLALTERLISRSHVAHFQSKIHVTLHQSCFLCPPTTCGALPLHCAAEMYAGMMKMKKPFWKKGERKITKPSLTPLICSEQRSSGDKLTLLALSLVSRSPPQPPWLVAINSQSSRGNSRRAALFYRVVKGNLGRDASWVINISPWPRLTLKVCML